MDGTFSGYECLLTLELGEFLHPHFGRSPGFLRLGAALLLLLLGAADKQAGGGDNEWHARAATQTGSGFTVRGGGHAPLHGLPYVLHPGVPLVSGAGVNLVHLRAHRGGGDQEHSSLLVGHLSDDQLLQGNHRRLLVLAVKKAEDTRERRVEGWRGTGRALGTAPLIPQRCEV